MAWQCKGYRGPLSVRSITCVRMILFGALCPADWDFVSKTEGERERVMCDLLNNLERQSGGQSTAI